MPKMNPIIKQKFVTALRSGDYKQGNLYLCKRVNGQYEYCALGVLLDVMNWPNNGDDDAGVRHYMGGDVTLLPYDASMEAFDGNFPLGPQLKRRSGNLGSIAAISDTDGTFSIIADLVEQQL